MLLLHLFRLDFKLACMLSQDAKSPQQDRALNIPLRKFIRAPHLSYLTVVRHELFHTRHQIVTALMVDLTRQCTVFFQNIQVLIVVELFLML